MNASIFDSALSHIRRSDASEKREENSMVALRSLLNVFACGQVSCPRLYRLKSTVHPPICHTAIFPQDPIYPQFFFGHKNVTNRRMHCISNRPHLTANNALLLSIMNKFFFDNWDCLPKTGLHDFASNKLFFLIKKMLIIIYTNASLEILYVILDFFRDSNNFPSILQIHNYGKHYMSPYSHFDEKRQNLTVHKAKYLLVSGR